MKRVLARLLHIRDAFDRIVYYTQGGKDEFDGSSLIQDGVIRNLTVVGEATKHVPEDFRAAHPDIPWAFMAGMRDVIVHRYPDIDLDAVWDTASNDVPNLYPKIDRLIHQLSKHD